MPPEELVHGLSIFRELPIPSGRCKEYTDFEGIFFLQIERYLGPLLLLMVIEDEPLSLREAVFERCQEVLGDGLAVACLRGVCYDYLNVRRL